MCKITNPMTPSHANSTSADSSSPAAATTAANQVSWQTCVWILIALAANIMFQPCGKVCSQPSRYKLYMRSSPLICLFDAVSVLIRLIVVSAYFQISPLKSLRILVADRFEEEDSQALVNSTWIRWLMFVLSALPLTIKLCSFRGTPITKFVGFCYVGPFLLFELLIHFSPEAEILVSAYTFPHSVLNDPASHRIFYRLGFLDFVLLCISIYVPIVISVYELQWVFFRWEAGLLVSFWAHIFASAVSALVLLCSMTYVFFKVVFRICGCLTTLGENLMIVFPGRHGQLSMDRVAVSALFFFFVHVLLVVFTYWAEFDSDSTENPGWTSVFGK
jgi:hypothetical protein